MKESSIKALTFSTFRPFSISDIIVSSSHDGELIIVSQHYLVVTPASYLRKSFNRHTLYFPYNQVNGDQELLFVSTLLQKEAYR